MYGFLVSSGSATSRGRVLRSFRVTGSGVVFMRSCSLYAINVFKGIYVVNGGVRHGSGRKIIIF